MKTIMRGLTLAAVLLTGAVTQAELVIDDFTSAGSTGFGVSDTTRTALTKVGLNAGFSNINAGQLSLLATAPTGGYGEFTLSFANPGSLGINPKGWGYYHTLFLRGVNAAGNWTVNVEATNGTSPIGKLKSLVQIADGTTSDVAIELTNLDHVSNLDGLQSLKFTFTNLTSGAGGAVLTVGAITAVPEPATMSLLGLTAIGGIFAHRRRKNQLAA